MLLLAFSFVSVFASCHKDGDTINSNTTENSGSSVTFKALLPLTISMADLKNNEKFFDFPTALPTTAANPDTIQTGDLMLYGSRTLVLFYKTFPTSYSYTKLGRIDDTTGLAAALGSGNVSITFSE